MTAHRHLLASAVAVLATAACTASPATPASHPADTSPVGIPVSIAASVTPASAPPADPSVHATMLLGYSTDHRPIVVVHTGDFDSANRLLVVGAIHGNETAGIAIARRLDAQLPPAETDLWVVTNLNPDGAARHTRGNARGVDLNRNFPDRWQPLGPPGATFYAGTGPGSEPETRLMIALLRRIQPTVGIWYHQALHVVDTSQGPARTEHQYAAITALPARPLPDYPGSAVGYEDQLHPATAFVVELAAGPLTAAQLRRHVAAVLAIAAARHA